MMILTISSAHRSDSVEFSAGAVGTRVEYKTQCSK